MLAVEALKELLPLLLQAQQLHHPRLHLPPHLHPLHQDQLEVLQEVLLEVLQEVLLEVLPEVLPEVLLEVLLEVLPEVLPEVSLEVLED